MERVDTCYGPTLRYNVPAVGEWDDSAALVYCFGCGEVFVASALDSEVDESHPSRQATRKR